MSTSKTPLIVFLIPIEEMSDESIDALNNALGQVKRIMSVFHNANPERIQALDFCKTPFPTRYLQLDEAPQLNLFDHVCPNCANNKCDIHDC